MSESEKVKHSFVARLLTLYLRFELLLLTTPLATPTFSDATTSPDENRSWHRLVNMDRTSEAAVLRQRRLA